MLARRPRERLITLQKLGRLVSECDSGFDYLWSAEMNMPAPLVREYPDLWLHIDAAWAGVALACPEFQEMLHLDAINEHVHSFCTNFHKVSTIRLLNFVRSLIISAFVSDPVGTSQF